MKLLALVTLYHPSPGAEERLATYASHADALLLWDNTPGGSCLSLPEAVRRKLLRWRKGPNTGIGQALNEALCEAEAGGYTHLLTMDQDSAFAEGSFPTYMNAMEQASDSFPALCVYVPAINRPAADEPPCRTSGFIISGTVFPVETLRRVGRFNEKLVIDALDVDYACRLREAGGTVVRIAQGSLRHELGYPLSRRILCWHPVSLNYSPLRVYYIARNFLFLQKKYPGHIDRRLVRKLVWMRPLYILLMERSKAEKLRAWLAGVRHGLRGDLARDAYFERMMNP